MTWFLKALIAAILLIITPFMTSVLEKKYQIPSEVTLFWWTIGIGVGVGFWTVFKGYGSIMLSVRPILVAGGAAIVFGTLAHILLYQAYANSPNPGVPMAIIAGNAILAVLLTKLFSKYLPQYFSHLEFSWPHLIGAILIISGVVVIRLWG